MDFYSYNLLNLLCRKFIKVLKKFIPLIIFILIFMLLTNTCFAATSEDIYIQVKDLQDSRATVFTALMYKLYVNNSQQFNNVKYVFDDIIEKSYYVFFDIYNTGNASTYGFKLYCHSPKNSYTSQSNINYTALIDNSVVSVPVNYYDMTVFNFVYNPTTDTISVSQSIVNYGVARSISGYNSPYWEEFLNSYQSGYVNYGVLLNSIDSYLSSLSNIVASDLNTIIGSLNIISSTLSSLVSNMPNYSSQINNISGGIDSILQDNQDIINQNTDMINEQQQINSNLENLNDNLMNDNFDNSNLNLPTNNTQNTADSGLNNIFINMYNAFCTGVAQDIVLPIPFTNKNITIEPDFLYNALYNSNANWLILFIQAFWGYLIGRFIVLDVNSKFNKIKSGNIENLENSNIKGDLL